MRKHWKFWVLLPLTLLIIILVVGLIDRFIAYRKFKNETENMEAVTKTIAGRAQYADLLLYSFQIVIPPGWYVTSPKGTESMKALPDDAFVMTNYPPVTTSFFQYLFHRPARQPNTILIRITFEKQTKHSLETLEREIENKRHSVTRFLYSDIETSKSMLNGYNTLLIHQKDDLGEIIELIGPNSNRFTITIKTQDGLSKNRGIIDEILSSLILLDEKSRADTSRWSRFEHKLNFSIDVPPTYSIPSEPQRVTDEDGTLAEKWEFIPTDRKNYFSFSIWVSEDSPFKSIEGWNEKSSFLKTHRFSDEKTVLIAEYPVFQYKAHPCESNATCSSHILSYGLIFYIDSTMVHVRSDNLRILAATVDEAENIFDFLRVEELFNQIISTLRLPPHANVSLIPSPVRKSYMSNSVGISFRYPNLFKGGIITIEEPGSNATSPGKTIFITNNAGITFGITRFDNSEYLSVHDWWDLNFEMLKAENYFTRTDSDLYLLKDSFTLQEVLLSNNKFISFSSISHNGYLYPTGRFLYLFRFLGYPEHDRDARDLFSQILPTTRFSE